MNTINVFDSGVRRQNLLTPLLMLAFIVAQHHHVGCTQEDGQTVASWGHLKGRFVVSGDLPKPRRLHVHTDQASFGDVVTDESLMIDPTSRGLSNVVIYARDIKADAHPDYKDFLKRGQTLSFRRGRYQPRVVALHTGQSLNVNNTDPVSHNFHVTPLLANPSRSVLIPSMAGMAIKFDRPEGFPFMASDMIHHWERAWLVVRDNPYFAVTGKDGSFEIRNLPVGEFEFQFWHERVGSFEAKPEWNKGLVKIQIRAGETTDLDKITVSAETFDQKIAGADVVPMLEESGALITTDPDGQVVSISMGSNANDDFLDQMKQFKNLSHLSISSSVITEQGFKHLGEMSSLSSLEFYMIPINDECLAHLKHSMSLQKLSMRECAIGDEGLKHLAGLRSLEMLALGGNRITDSGLAHIKSLTQLVELDITHTNWVESRMRITDAGLAHLAPLTNIRQLNIDNLPISNRGLKHLASMREMRQLTFASSNISSDGLRVLENFPKLEAIHLRGPTVDDDCMEHVGKCPNLKTVTMMYTSVGDAGMKQIANLGRLERLDISSRHVTDDGIAHLASLMNLNHLSLRCSHVGDAGLKHISTIRSLKRLDLSGSGEPGVHLGMNFSSTGLAHLEKMEDLETLWLSNMQVSWTTMKNMKQLKSLVMFMVSMSNDDVRHLQKTLPNTRVSASTGGGSIAPIEFESSEK